MIVIFYQENIFVEIQIKIKPDELSENEKIRDTYNHMLYEMERALSVSDIIKALEFQVKASKDAKIEKKQKETAGLVDAAA